MVVVGLAWENEQEVWCAETSGCHLCWCRTTSKNLKENILNFQIKLGLIQTITIRVSPNVNAID